MTEEAKLVPVVHEKAIEKIAVPLIHLSSRFQCGWPCGQRLIMLCDGRLVCGCADPYGNACSEMRERPPLKRSDSPVVTTLRQDLNQGGSSFCGDCPLKLRWRKMSPIVRPLEAGRSPPRMFIEYRGVTFS